MKDFHFQLDGFLIGFHPRVEQTVQEGGQDEPSVTGPIIAFINVWPKPTGT